jgi:primosomal protein N' (replication factor Y)
VAVVGIDEALFSADFRATERLAQLIVQVSGRAGRADKPGVVWLQTHHPGHPLLLRLVHDGYEAFAQDELDVRRALEFPPFSYLALLRAEAKQLSVASTFMQDASAAAADTVRLLGEVASAQVRWHGPVPAPMPRRAGFQRLQLVVQAPARRHLHAFLRPWTAALYALPDARRVRWSLDVDPSDLY